MNWETVDKEVLRLGLYAVFHLKNESYITSVKLFYIYDFIAPIGKEDSLRLLGVMKKNLKHRSNKGRIDELYQMIKMIQMERSGRYDTHTLQPPSNRPHYIPGHKL